MGDGTWVVRQRNPYDRPLLVMSADGAITMKDGIVVVTKAGACAMTLAAPNADDNGMLIVYSTTAQAHTLTISGGLRGAGSGADVGTFGGAIADGIVLFAYNGAWYEVPGTNTNVTFA